MSGRPGDSCVMPGIHSHWCGFCGALQYFSETQCRQLLIVPPCPRCGGKDWRDEIDEMTAPDFRESGP